MNSSSAVVNDRKEVPGALCFTRRSTPGFRDKLQLQDDFQGTDLSSLYALGLGVYEKLPDFRDRCPLCGGRRCAVRHGLYFRRVLDADGRLYEDFPIARFLCRRKGPARAQDVTFSVLPLELVSRRRFSLPLMVWVLELLLVARHSVSQVVEAFAQLFQQQPEPLLIEPLTVYRMLRLFAGVYQRLSSFPLAQTTGNQPSADQRACALILLEWLAEAARRAPPRSLVWAFHQRYFPHLLFDLRLAG